jgi:hypothetical protein
MFKDCIDLKEKKQVNYNELVSDKVKFSIIQLLIKIITIKYAA